MRFSGVIFLIITCFKSSAQVEFEKQINAIIADSSNHFKNFRGEFKFFLDGDSVFSSTIQIEGTKKNGIFANDSMSIYSSTIVDTIIREQGKKIFEEWHQKLTNFLGELFINERLEIKPYNPALDGWDYKRDNITLSIRLYPHYKNSPYCWMIFSIGITNY